MGVVLDRVNTKGFVQAAVIDSICLRVATKSAVGQLLRTLDRDFFKTCFPRFIPPHLGAGCLDRFDFTDLDTDDFH